MVAPIQGSIGRNSADPVVQDDLNLYANFYSKPENEGIESEFTTPDGKTYKIQDASDFSKLKSNVNTGKHDNKAVDKDADTKVGNYAEEKKAKADKQGSQDPAAAQNNAESKSSGGFSLSDAVNIVGKMDKVISGGSKSIDKLQAEQPVSQAKVAKIKAGIDENTKIQNETFKSMQQGEAVLKAISAQTVAKAEQSFTKAVAAREAKAKAKSSAAEESSTTQSGSKMGFEGKLATTAPASSGNGGSSATDKAWENTMKGKITVSKTSINTGVPKLTDVRAAGSKAAQPLLDSADASRVAADNAVAGKSDAIDQGRNQMLQNGVACGVSAVATDKLGFQAVLAWAVKVPAAWAAGGFGAAVAIAKAIGFTVATIASGAATYLSAKGVSDTADNTDKTIAGMRANEAKLDAQAEQQTAQSVSVRRQAVAQAQKQNIQIMKAQQALAKATQECSAGLSASSISSVSTDGMDEEQLEAVKQDRYDQVMAHEQEHAAIIGGSPVIETDANGVAVGGYVEIELPALDESDLEGTIEKAQLVVDAALAPSDPSSQDQNVASQARDILARAQELLEEKTTEAEKEEEEKPEEKKDELQKKDEVKPELRKEAKKAA